VKPLLRLPEPPDVVTDTVAGPTVPAGVVAVMVVGLTTFTFEAAAPPICTVAGATNPVPVIVTFVLPPVGPWLGLIAVTVGAPT
jgi:hypothetical protein